MVSCCPHWPGRDQHEWVRAPWPQHRPATGDPCMAGCGFLGAPWGDLTARRALSQPPACGLASPQIIYGEEQA